MIGAIFAVAAYGMALVWGVMNVINVVQGEFVMLGGFITYQLTLWGVSPLWGVPVAAIVLYFIGAGLHHVVIRRVADRDMFISLLATFGALHPATAADEPDLGRRRQDGPVRPRHVVPARLHGDGLADEGRSLRRRHRHRWRADPLPQEEQDRPGDPRDRAEPSRRAHPRHRHQPRLRRYLRHQRRALRRRRRAGGDGLFGPPLTSGCLTPCAPS